MMHSGNFFNSRRLALGLLMLQLITMLMGTQMPGLWRTGIELGRHAQLSASSLAHFALFFGMASVLMARPLHWPLGRIVMAGLGLALLSALLQHLTGDRSPGWMDVGISVAGVVFAETLYVAKLVLLCCGPRW